MILIWFLCNAVSCCGPLLQDLVTVLLKLDPFDRPSAAQVLSIPVLQGPVRVAYNKCVRHRRRQDNDHHYTVSNMMANSSSASDKILVTALRQGGVSCMLQLHYLWISSTQID